MFVNQTFRINRGVRAPSCCVLTRNTTRNQRQIHLRMSSSNDRPVEEKEDVPREVPQLGALEEDDEFEEFPENGALL